MDTAHQARRSVRGCAVAVSPERGERNVSDKPGWVRSSDLSTRDERARLVEDQRLESETLLGVDDAIERIVDQLRASGELEQTVIIFMTDNGFSFGQHRIRGKRCQYDECIRTPFAARVPGAEAHDVPG